MTNQIGPPDADELSARIREARERAGWTREQMASRLRVGTDLLSDAEDGVERVTSGLLQQIADVTGRSLTWFLEPPLQAVASRRVVLAEPGAVGVDTPFDRMLEEIGTAVRMLCHRGLLTVADRPRYRSPADVTAAEALAALVRRDFGVPDGPLDDLASLCETTGLLPFSLDVGSPAVAGSMIDVDGCAGIALVNGTTPPGQRRFTLAHELGHWLTGDDYEAVTSGASGTERMLNAFAAHLLLPRSDVTREWAEASRIHGRWNAAVVISGRYGMSWSATVGQLRNLGLISHLDHDQLLDAPPSWVDFEINDAVWTPALEPPFVSPVYRRAVLSAYTRGELTRDRTVDLLWGAVTRESLPVLPAPFRPGRRRSRGPRR